MTGDDAAESVPAYEFVDHFKRRWRFIAAVCAIAGALALIVSLLLPRQYTATASIAIEPPAGSDPRLSVAMNPVYFESLRAYETFASSDTLFAQALDKFHLRDAGAFESLKRKILKVATIKDTKILQVSATLPDARQAQAMAQYIAEQTVDLNRSSSLANDQDLVADARARTAAAQQTLEQAQSAWRDFASQHPYESLRSDLDALSAAEEKLKGDLVAARENSARGSVDNLQKQDDDLQRQIQAKAAALADRDARAQEFDQKIRAAQTAYEGAALHQRDLESALGTRSERLRVIDPGVVPERPSSPVIPLNVLLAIGVALIASLTYVTLTFRPLR